MNIKLCIDPGHGMGNVKSGVYDPGATSGQHKEADIALEWALTIKHYCSLAGIPVFLTRTSDKDAAPVGQRATRAKAAGCTHFLSIHCNAAGSALASGTETFYRNSQQWADKVQSLALRAMGLKDRGVKHESASQHTKLAVMNFPGHVCLLELGFITNGFDCAKMRTRDCRIKFAEELVEYLTKQGKSK